jgi:uncharacterized membrane protein (UPF0127 family)
LAGLYCNGRLIIGRCEEAVGPLQRASGLLGRKTMDDDYAMYFPCCSMIHTFFMGMPIDVAMLSGEGRAVCLWENLKPWRFASCLRARHTVEMKAGSIEAFSIKEGDILGLAPRG